MLYSLIGTDDRQYHELEINPPALIEQCQIITTMRLHAETLLVHHKIMLNLYFFSEKKQMLC